MAQTSSFGLPMITEEKARQIQCAIESASKFMAIPATTVGFGRCSQFEATQVVNGLYRTFFGDRALAQCIR